jgi:hypothetical protein
MLETFEHELQQVHERTLGPDDRAAISALRESWSRLVAVAFGPVRHVRSCTSCRRSQLRTGPRCVFCWHRIETFDGPDRPQI